MDPSVPWDEFTTLPSDPQMLANMSAAGKSIPSMPHSHPQAVWNQPATPIAGMPPGPNPPAALPGAPTVPSQPQSLSPASPYAVQPDGSLWQMTPPPGRSMTFPAQPTSNMTSYPSPGPAAAAAAGGFAPPVPNLKRSVTSPSQGFHGLNPQSPSGDMQAPVPVTYAAQAQAQPQPQPQPQPSMGYPAWQDVSVPAVNVVPYPVYTDAPQQTYGSPSMGQGPPGQPQ